MISLTRFLFDLRDRRRRHQSSASTRQRKHQKALRGIRRNRTRLDRLRQRRIRIYGRVGSNNRIQRRDDIAALQNKINRDLDRANANAPEGIRYE